MNNFERLTDMKKLQTKVTAVVSALFTLLAWFAIPQSAVAGVSPDESFVDTSNNFTARLSGANSISFQLPLYDGWGWRTDRWINVATMHYTVLNEDGSVAETAPLITWKCTEKDIDSDKNTDRAWIQVKRKGFHRREASECHLLHHLCQLVCS